MPHDFYFNLLFICKVKYSSSLRWCSQCNLHYCISGGGGGDFYWVYIELVIFFSWQQIMCLYDKKYINVIFKINLLFKIFIFKVLIQSFLSNVFLLSFLFIFVLSFLSFKHIEVLSRLTFFLPSVAYWWSIDVSIFLSGCCHLLPVKVSRIYNGRCMAIRVCSWSVIEKKYCSVWAKYEAIDTMMSLKDNHYKSLVS